MEIMAHRVLIVDDDSNLLNALRRSLHKEPYEILTAESAERALILLKSEQVDAVISDQNMPGMCGVEFLAKVAEAYPHTVRFMLTGQATVEVAVGAINKGAITRFFTKPWHPIDLVTTLRQSLEQKDLMDQARRLLMASKRQSNIIDRLEKKVPGITKVEKDETGRIVMEKSPVSYVELLREISEQVDAAEKQTK